MVDIDAGGATPALPRRSAGIRSGFVEVLRRFGASFLEVVAPSPHGPAALEIRSVTEQFFLTLRAAFLRVPEPRADDAAACRIHERATALVNSPDPPSWDRNYQLEQYLVDLYDPSALRTEVEVRVLEARRVLGPDLATWYADELARMRRNPEGEDRKAEPPEACAVSLRAILGRLVNDLQWRYKMRETARAYRQQISRDTAVAFLAIVALFLTVLLLFGLRPQWFRQLDDGRDSHVCGILIVAAIAGSFGAGFSMLLNQGKRLGSCALDDLKMLSSRVVLGSRVLVGAGAGMILLCFLRGGLVTGGAFPDLAELADKGAQAYQALALLVFWCFLSGFSEKLVPTILSRMESRVVQEERPGSRPVGPTERSPDAAGPPTAGTGPSN